MTLSEYLLQLTPADQSKTIDCQLNLALNVPSGFTTAVTTFSYQGYLNLDLGVRATGTASYSWQGRASSLKTSRRDAIGPFDGTYLDQDDVQARTLQPDFLPCDGQTRNLVVQTSLALIQATTGKRYSYVNTSSVDGNVKSRSAFNIGFAKKKC